MSSRIAVPSTTPIHHLRPSVRDREQPSRRDQLEEPLSCSPTLNLLLSIVPGTPGPGPLVWGR